MALEQGKLKTECFHEADINAAVYAQWVNRQNSANADFLEALDIIEKKLRGDVVSERERAWLRDELSETKSAEQTIPLTRGEPVVLEPLEIFTADSGSKEVIEQAPRVPVEILSRSYGICGEDFNDALRFHGGSFTKAIEQVPSAAVVLNEWLHIPLLEAEINAVAKQAGGTETLREFQSRKNVEYIENRRRMRDETKISRDL